MDEICEHCRRPVTHRDSVKHNDKYYHRHCSKCYVCSETDLTNSEMFKGVIFCAGCAQRIFQGCASIRKSRNYHCRGHDDNCRGNNDHGRSRKDPYSSRRPRRSRSRRVRRSQRPLHREAGIIELARLAAGSSEATSSEKEAMGKKNDNIVMTTQLHQNCPREVFVKGGFNLKQNSAEIGITTDVTQELLKQVECPVNAGMPMECLHSQIPVQRPSVNRRTEKKDPKLNCSDLRVAELGASTEIATMGLRKKSEMPVRINDCCDEKSTETIISPETMSSGRLTEDCIRPSASASTRNSRSSFKRVKAFTSLRRRRSKTHIADEDTVVTYVNNDDDGKEKLPWQDRQVLSVMKMPFKLFKKRILDRSSFISIASKEYAFESYLKKLIKRFCNDDVITHQYRGMQKLYPSINNRQSPLRLGLSMVKVLEATKQQKKPPYTKCKHYDKSHSYQCMRDLVMARAGPTKSQLAVIRRKLGHFVCPRFIRNYFSLYNKNITYLPCNLHGLRVIDPAPGVTTVTKKVHSSSRESANKSGINKTPFSSDPHDPRNVFKELASATFFDTTKSSHRRNVKRKHSIKPIPLHDLFRSIEAKGEIKNMPSKDRCKLGKTLPNKRSKEIPGDRYDKKLPPKWLHNNSTSPLQSSHNHHIGRLTVNRY